MIVSLLTIRKTMSTRRAKKKCLMKVKQNHNKKTHFFPINFILPVSPISSPSNPLFFLLIVEILYIYWLNPPWSLFIFYTLYWTLPGRVFPRQGVLVLHESSYNIHRPGDNIAFYHNVLHANNQIYANNSMT